MTERKENFSDTSPGEKSAFERWVESEGLDLVGGLFVEDLKTIPLKPWARKGGLGVYIKLDGAGWENAAYVCEIAPGKALKPQRHLFEENIYILRGEGSTRVWNDRGKEQTVEWKAGSLFAIPLNTWHEHRNRSKEQAARYVAVTLAPSMINIFRDTDFIFNTSHDFKDRFDGEPGYFKEEKKVFKDPGGFKGRILETNFVLDVPGHALAEREERGAGGRNIRFEMAGNVMDCHVSEFPVGTYKKTHRHGPSAHVIIIKGKGYSLMWPKESPMQRYDWHEGSLFVPPDQWWHQHFNTGNTPARYLALHGMRSHKYKIGIKLSDAIDVKKGGDQIEYADEPPEVRENFEKELAKSGIICRMAAANIRR
ncbi:MAG: cupin domain-containing protein [Thermodesulfobacteriota bacterium]